MKICILIFSLLCNSPLMAQSESFHPGLAIPDFGKIATVKDMVPLPKDAKFKVSFDLDKPAEPGEINRSLEGVARFINMHVAVGVPMENIDLAVVIHGKSVKEMTTDDFYQKDKDNDNDLGNANMALIKALQSKGVSFYVCGQSAAYHGVKASDLLSGVNMSLSAMTAHALLQQQGYTLNPF